MCAFIVVLDIFDMDVVFDEGDDCDDVDDHDHDHDV